MKRFLNLFLLSGSMLMTGVSLDGSVSTARASEADEKDKKSSSQSTAAAPQQSERPLNIEQDTKSASYNPMSVEEFAKTFLTPDMSELSRSNIINALARVPAADRPTFITQVRSLITKDMSGFSRSRIINALARVPEEIRTQTFITQVQSLITPAMDDDISSVIDAFAEVPAADRPTFITQVRSLITKDMSGLSSTTIIKALARVPAADRPIFITQVRSLITQGMSGFSRSMIINALARVPEEIRTQTFITQVQSLITPAMDDDISRIIDTLASVTANNRAAFVAFCVRNRVQNLYHMQQLARITDPNDWQATLAGIRNVAPNQIIGLNNQSVHDTALEQSISDSVQKLQKLYPTQYETLDIVVEAITKRMESLQKQNLLKPVDARIMGVFLSGAQVLSPGERAKILRYFDLALQALDDKEAAKEASAEAVEEEAYDKAIRDKLSEAEAKKIGETAKEKALKKEFTPKEMDDRFAGWLRSGPIDAQLAYILDNLGGKTFKDKNALYEALEKNFEANVGAGKSCLGGSYNRLIVALNKIHPAVKIDYGQASKANAQLLWLRNALQKQGKELVEKAKKDGTSEDALRKVGPEVLEKFVESQQKAELNFLTPEKINATVEAYLKSDFEAALLTLKGKDGITAYIEDGGMEKDVLTFLGTQKNPFDTTLLTRAREATEKGVEAMLKKHADMREDERKEHLQTAKSLVPGILGAYQIAYLKDVAQKVIATLPNKAAGSETMDQKADRMDALEKHLKAAILKRLKAKILEDLGELVSKENLGKLFSEGNEETIAYRIQDVLHDDGIMALMEGKGVPTASASAENNEKSEKDEKNVKSAAATPGASGSATGGATGSVKK